MGARAEQLDFGGAAVQVGEDPEVPEGLFCPHCCLVKAPTEFHRSNFSKTGWSSWCKVCVATNSRGVHLEKRYGLTEEQFDEMLEAQGNRCAACGTSDPGGRYGRFHVDHNHRTGAVRALLCAGCNTALGGVKDSIPVLMSLVAYLHRHSN